MSGKIFVNYRREDSAPNALSIAQYLENVFGKGSVFIDIDQLRAGQKFPVVLEEKLNDCRVMLVVIGPNWLHAKDEKSGARRFDNSQDWVRLEIERALAHGVTVIPVLVRGARMPDKADLPPAVQPLVDHQAAIVTTEGFRHEMAGLSRDITEILGLRRWRPYAIGLGALAVGAVVVFTWLGVPIPRQWLESLQFSSGTTVREAADQKSADERRFEEEKVRATESVRPPDIPSSEEAKGSAEAQAATEAEVKKQVEEVDRQHLSMLRAQEQKMRTPETVPKAAAVPNPGKMFRDCPDCPEMVVVPGGDFLMGSPDDEPGRRESEGPVHSVKFKKPFAVGRYAVTRDEYMAFVSATSYPRGKSCRAEQANSWVDIANASYDAPPGFSQSGRHPVVCISWNDSQAYVIWLSKQTQEHYRLLTEPEREYVARANTMTAYWWGNAVSPQQANYDVRPRTAASQADNDKVARNSKSSESTPRGYTKAVDSFQPNPWGLFNVHGNVAEWIEDCWSPTYAAAPTDGSASLNGDCSRRVVRGGGWSYWPEDIRSAYRESAKADESYFHIGFRIAREIAE